MKKHSPEVFNRHPLGPEIIIEPSGSLRTLGIRKSQSMNGIFKTFGGLHISKQTSSQSKLYFPADCGSSEFQEPDPQQNTQEPEPQQNKLIRVGVCCREKKMRSRPMQKILGWLAKVPAFEICCMNDDMILNKPIEEWLRCDVLIGFYSYGFPLQKAIDYVEKYKPKQINDFAMQRVLWDRPSVLERLKKRGILVAKSYVVLRGDDAKRHEMSLVDR
jgi:hypothetical protein